MSTLVKTKRRISSVTNTRKVTNAMELVASVKLKRFKNTMTEGDNYVSEIRNVMNRLSSLTEKDYDFSKPSNNRLFIIVNSNLGLCASYNSDIFRYASTIVKENDEIIPIGLKGYNHFKNLSFKLNSDYVALNEKINFDDVNKLSAFVLDQFEKHHYASIHIIYMEYVNTITYRAKSMELLPLTLDSDQKEDLLPPIIEPNPKALLKELTPIYLASTIYQAIVTSQVSEQASRNNAMKNATDNADDLLDKLKLEYNKARQGAITQEITEVVAGSNNN